MMEYACNPLIDVSDTEDVKAEKRRKKNWEAAFQRWSDRNADNPCDSLGVCGYGTMCEYCECAAVPNPCIKALRRMMRETGKRIDYSTKNYEEVWLG